MHAYASFASSVADSMYTYCSLHMVDKYYHYEVIEMMMVKWA